MSFERPAMKQLLELVEQNQVQTVIVKDLSRFGRNYLDSGFYQEILFPRHNVRLIAVDDNYDSANPATLDNALEWRIKNLQNHFYSLDLSRKITSSTELIRRNGQHIGQIPYGYVKGNAKNQITVDTEAAEIVRLIFHLASHKGMEINDIARHLNAKEIPTPSQLKHSRGFNCHVRAFWCNNTIYRILTNRTYTGYLDLRKSRPKEIGSKQFDLIPRGQREVVRGQHTALVSLETYEQAQAVIHRKERTKHPTKDVSRPLLHNYLVCQCCGNKLVHRRSFGNLYICPYHSVHLASDCEQIECNAQQIEQVVLHAIQNLVALSEASKLQHQKQLDEVIEAIQQHSKEIYSLQRTSAKLNELRLVLYDGYLEQTLSKSDFLIQKENIAQQQQQIADEIDLLSAQIVVLRQQAEQHQRASDSTPSFAVDQLSPALLESLVSKVIISADGAAEIVFRFQEQFKESAS